MELKDAVKIIGTAQRELSELMEMTMETILRTDLPADEQDALTREQADTTAARVHDYMHTVGIGALGEKSRLRHREDDQ